MPTKAIKHRYPIKEEAPLVPLGEIQRKVERSPGFFSVYANDVQFFVSQWDMRLVLGQLGDPELAGNVPMINIEQIGEVRLSLQIAKKLVAMLSDHISIYEKTFGPIPSEPNHALQPTVSRQPS